MQKLADALSASSPEHLYLKLVSHWDNPIALVLGASEPSTPITDPRFGLDSAEMAERMMLLDTITYLPDDILVKLDRASMSASLEARTPLLDHTLFEFAWSLPHHLKIRDKQGKWILRQTAVQVCAAIAARAPQRLDLQFHWMSGCEGPCVTGRNRCLMNHGSEQTAISTHFPFAGSGMNTSRAEETGSFCFGTSSCFRRGWRTAEKPAFLERRFQTESASLQLRRSDEASEGPFA